MEKKYRVAVVGVGLVGEEIIRVLEELEFPFSEMLTMARSAREEMLAGKKRKVHQTSLDLLRTADIALFAGTEGDKGAANEFGLEAAKSGTVVIDNGADFRMDPKVPLVVPEVNPEALRSHSGLIANPNCSTIQMVVALAPLHRAAGIKRVVVSTYQAVSGTGTAGKKALQNQRRIRSENGEVKEFDPYPHPIFDNLIPQIGSVSDAFAGYYTEEVKMVRETQKILGAPNMAITATCVRVPVINSHSEAINVQFERDMSPEEARELLSKSPGVTVVDDPKRSQYPMPLFASGRNDTFVGRIRRDPSAPNALDMWVVADNIRKGAATNAVQIALEMIRQKLL